MKNIKDKAKAKVRSHKVSHICAPKEAIDLHGMTDPPSEYLVAVQPVLNQID